MGLGVGVKTVSEVTVDVVVAVLLLGRFSAFADGVTGSTGIADDVDCTDVLEVFLCTNVPSADKLSSRVS